MGTYLLAALLFFCWTAALVTLLIFLESWFAVSSRDRFVARRASGLYGPISIFLLMRGRAETLDRVIRSILGQSYPFIELFLIYPEDDPELADLAREFRTQRSHVKIRAVSAAHAIKASDDRIRVLEATEPMAKGRWYVLMHPDVVLDRFAVEASLEFAGSGGLSALALRPGIQCRSLLQRLLAPSVEYLLHMVRIIERRERAQKVDLEASYMLVNRESFQAVNQMNRLPGILNEAGWSLWSYQVEGLSTFEGDGSQWMWREIWIRSWPSCSATEKNYTRRSASLVIAGTITALIPVLGLAYGFSGAVDTFLEAGIFAFSAVSYALMGISYYLYARRLHAASWFAPLWFLAHAPASIVAFLDIRKQVSSDNAKRPEVIHK